MRYAMIAAIVGCTSALAQTTSTSNEMPSTAALPPAERGGPRAIGLSLYWENDGAFTNPINSTDKWYTSGSAAAVQWQGPDTTDALSPMPSIGGEFDASRPGVSYAAGALAALNIYTPGEITNPNIQPEDRPYAGWTYLGFVAERANRDLKTPTFEYFELDAGAMGPMSRAGDAQKWVHSYFDSGEYPAGWDYEVKDEVGVDFKYQRRWRYELMEPERPTGPAMQLIPDAGAMLGTIHTNASAGATLRYGWNLPDDFGPGSMHYLDDFTRPMGPDAGLKNGVSGYFFVRPGVRLVAHDSTYGDSLFRSDNPVTVDTEPVVGEFTAGVVVTFWKHCRVSYIHTTATPEFKGQGDWHSFAAVGMSLVYTW